MNCLDKNTITKISENKVMTHQEKAIELVENFCHKISLFSSSEIHYIELAKQCALIAVNQIIEALETYDDMTEKHLKREFPNYLSCELQNMEQDFRYYEQVKREIEKL